jgi:hypothetical protein
MFEKWYRDAQHTAIIGDDAAPVAVNQAKDEFFGRLVDERLLPWLECDPSGVLLAGAVLGEKARPVLGVQRHFDAVLGQLHDPCALTGHQHVDCFPAPVDDRRVLRVQHDAETPDSADP